MVSSKHTCREKLRIELETSHLEELSKTGDPPRPKACHREFPISPSHLDGQSVISPAGGHVIGLFSWIQCYPSVEVKHAALLKRTWKDHNVYEPH